MRGTASAGKRTVDLLLGSILSVLALPLILVFALVCAATYRCWPFFTQERVGRYGRCFRIVKLRTLPKTAPAMADKYTIEKLTLPRFATFLRSSHLDELPQLFLVVRGHMSLVGPRPEMAFLHDQGDPEFATARISVRPGCTGLWQVSGAARGLIWQGAEYDMFYLRHARLRFDFWILYRTFFAVRPTLKQVALADVPRWTHRKGCCPQAVQVQVVDVTERVIDFRDPLPSTSQPSGFRPTSE